MFHRRAGAPAHRRTGPPGPPPGHQRPAWRAGSDVSRRFAWHVTVL